MTDLGGSGLLLLAISRRRRTRWRIWGVGVVPAHPTTPSCFHALRGRIVGIVAWLNADWPYLDDTLQSVGVRWLVAWRSGIRPDAGHAVRF